MFKSGDVVVINNPEFYEWEYSGKKGVLLQKHRLLNDVWAVRLFDPKGVFTSDLNGIEPGGNGKWMKEDEMQIDDCYKVRQILKSYEV